MDHEENDEQNAAWDNPGEGNFEENTAWDNAGEENAGWDNPVEDNDEQEAGWDNPGENNDEQEDGWDNPAEESEAASDMDVMNEDSAVETPASFELGGEDDTSFDSGSDYAESEKSDAEEASSDAEEASLDERVEVDTDNAEGSFIELDVESTEVPDEEDGDEGGLANFPLVQAAAVAASLVFTFSAKSLIDSRRNKLVAEQIAFSPSRSHISELVDAFKKRERLFSPCLSLFENVLRIWLTERSLDIHTIMDVREVKRSLVLSDADGARAFLSVCRTGQTRETVLKARYIAEHVLPSTHHKQLQPLREICSPSLYREMERTFTRQCRESIEANELSYDFAEDFISRPQTVRNN